MAKEVTAAPMATPDGTRRGEPLAATNVAAWDLPTLRPRFEKGVTPLRNIYRKRATDAAPSLCRKAVRDKSVAPSRAYCRCRDERASMMRSAVDLVVELRRGMRRGYDHYGRAEEVDRHRDEAQVGDAIAMRVHERKPASARHPKFNFRSASVKCSRAQCSPTLTLSLDEDHVPLEGVWRALVEALARRLTARRFREVLSNSLRACGGPMSSDLVR